PFKPRALRKDRMSPTARTETILVIDDEVFVRSLTHLIGYLDNLAHFYIGCRDMLLGRVFGILVGLETGLRVNREHSPPAVAVFHHDQGFGRFLLDPQNLAGHGSRDQEGRVGPAEGRGTLLIHGARIAPCLSTSLTQDRR